MCQYFTTNRQAFLAHYAEETDLRLRLLAGSGVRTDRYVDAPVAVAQSKSRRK